MSGRSRLYQHLLDAARSLHQRNPDRPDYVRSQAELICEACQLDPSEYLGVVIEMILR